MEADHGAERVTLEAPWPRRSREAAQRVIDDARILGGSGCWPEPGGPAYRAVRALRIYEGTTEIQHLVIAGQFLREIG
jgi:acyl-CoA dehydrogenase